jgi:hypothetical protein
MEKKKNGKSVLRQMADDKKRVEEYFHTGDQNSPPAGIKFVKPFSLASLIEVGERDFAEGRGVIFTIDQLRSMVSDSIAE